MRTFDPRRTSTTSAGTRAPRRPRTRAVALTMAAVLGGGVLAACENDGDGINDDVEQDVEQDLEELDNDIQDGIDEVESEVDGEPDDGGPED